MCDKSFASYQNVRTHYREYHRIFGQLTCSCGKIFKLNRPNLIKIHMNWHDDPEVYK